VKSIPPALFQEVIFAVTDIAREHADFERLAAYYSTVASIGDADKMNFFNAALEKLYYESEDRKAFAERAAEAAGGGFFALMKLAANNGGSGLQSFLDGFEPISYGKLHGYSEMFYLAVKQGAELSALIKKLRSEQLEDALTTVFRQNADFPKILLPYCTIEAFGGSVKELFWAVFALEKASLQPAELSEGEKAELFHRFAAAAAIYVTNVYNPELLNDEDIGVLPPLHRFGYYIAAGQNALEQGDKAGYIRALKEALKNYKDMKDVISFLLNDFLTNM
jgi:hypothetical protein